MLRRFPALARLALAMLALSLSSAAAADSWGMPKRHSYYSADRRVRLIVTPNLRLARYYLEGPASARRPGGKARGRLERRGADGRWRLLWALPLVNDISPGSALVADSGDHVVTFNNWGSIGGGDHVVVIYGSGGRLVRSLRLTDLLPEDFIAELPHTFGSILWSGFGSHHVLAPDGGHVLLSVATPPREEDILGGPHFELPVALATGEPVRSGPAWDRAMATVPASRAAKRDRQAARLAFLAEPLTAPRTPDRTAWDTYLNEAFKRLAPDWKTNNGWKMLVRPPGEPPYDGAFSPDPKTIFAQRNLPAAIVIASPEGVALAPALRPLVEGRRAGWLRRTHLYIVAEDAVWPDLVGLFLPSGATLIQLDPSQPIPQRPERLPAEAPDPATSPG